MQADLMPDGFSIDALDDSLMQQAAIMLLAGDRHDAVAEALGIDRRTLFRWKNRPEWRDIFAKAQAEVIGSARVRLIGLVHKSIDKLDKLLDDSSGKGAPTEASIAWGVLDRVGVEVQAQQAEGVRRILTRVPRDIPAVSTAGPAPSEAVPEVGTASSEDRPAIHIVSNRHAAGT